MKHALRAPGSRSRFITSMIVPIHHSERETRFSVLEACLAMALIFGTIALMRLLLVLLHGGAHP
jgi:hypothetical protein